MASVLIENPILNSPFLEPARHFRTTPDGEVTGDGRGMCVPSLEPGERVGLTRLFDGRAVRVPTPR